MEFKLQGRRDCAFKLIELFVVLAVIVALAGLAGLILPAVALARYKSKRVQCLNNLKQVGIGLRIFAEDHSNKYPAQLGAAFGGAQEFVRQGEVFKHFLAMSNTIPAPKTLICPADNRKSATLFGDLKDGNISYFISLDAKVDQTGILLTGDRNLTSDGTPVNPGLSVLKTNSAIGFTRQLHRGSGNLILEDGSLWYAPDKTFEEHLRQHPMDSSRILIP